LLAQVNALYPARNKASDGMLGDAAHQAVKSEHNPNAEGVVTALDITHDPANGADMNKLATALLRSGDSRIWYIIFNRRIWEGGVWTPYYGENPHDKHLHISTVQSKAKYDDASKWNISEGGEMPITKDQENVLSVLATGGYPGKGYDYRFTGKVANQENLDAMVNFWADVSKLHGLIAKQAAPAVTPAKVIDKVTVVDYIQRNLQ
jgi:hypothetical protein